MVLVAVAFAVGECQGVRPTAFPVNVLIADLSDLRSTASSKARSRKSHIKSVDRFSFSDDNVTDCVIRRASTDFMLRVNTP
jgi:hypothetical protein